jgi:hypothetical protein
VSTWAWVLIGWVAGSGPFALLVAQGLERGRTWVPRRKTHR